MSSREIYLYTDGSSSPTEKTGGWAFCIVDEKQKLVKGRFHGSATSTTNNRMEMIAAINGLHTITVSYPEIKKVVVVTDSQYLTDPIYLGWLNLWHSDNYINRDNEEIKNSDLWKEIHMILKRFKIRGVSVDFHWVRGHNGNQFNEECDKMAKEARKLSIINSLY